MLVIDMNKSKVKKKKKKSNVNTKKYDRFYLFMLHIYEGRGKLWAELRRRKDKLENRISLKVWFFSRSIMSVSYEFVKWDFFGL